MAYYSTKRYKPHNGTPVNRAHPLLYGCISFWPFWEQSGRQVRDVVGRYHGTFSGSTPIWNINTGGGLWGVDFAGQGPPAGDFITMGNQPVFDFSTACTLAASYNHQSAADGAILSKMGTSPYNGFMLWRTSGANNIKAYVNGGVRATSATISVGTTYIIVATWDGSNWTLYVDGVAGTPGAYSTAPTSSAHEFRVGAYDDWSMSGAVHWAGVWNRALSAAEIVSLSDNPFQIFKLPTTAAEYYAAANPATSSARLLASLGVGR